MPARSSPLLLAALALATPAAADDLPAEKVSAALPEIETYVGGSTSLGRTACPNGAKSAETSSDSGVRNARSRARTDGAKR